MSAEPSPKRLKVDDEEGAEGVDAGPEGAPAENGAADWAPEAEDTLAAELEDCQRALDKVNDEASDRVLAVEQEYNKKRRPIYAQRAEIIQKVPLFWQRTLLSHPTLADQLTDDDSQVLEYLVELDVVDFDDIKSGFKVVLTFSPANTHFSDRSLVKSFHYGDDGKVTIEPAVIHWNEGYAPFPESGGPSYFFFEWMTIAEAVGEGTPDEVAEVLKDEIWPNPVKYFLNGDVEPAAYEQADLDEGLLEGEEFDEMAVGLDEAGEGEEAVGLEGGEEGDVLYDEAAGEGEGEGELGGEGEEGFADDGGGEGDEGDA
ncbi:hypothetical protein HXX76_013087 [Chlamydomonas incerta]|uniref:Nucleosome assembly protein n=1 Tax=Chlamydomonas incerta TaxID=51695 RepID=A0A835ST86_CHLIN|nr:hypothetical protein HXX76_013087 [Chlamydomonas incerta]|eukprot:KAG2426330.1 hypothetical protein HXX76_013087 [Chlamydomonas incerta]